jgi:hypothetical protein
MKNDYSTRYTMKNDSKSRPDGCGPEGRGSGRTGLVCHSLLATVEAIFNLGTLGRNDTYATPMPDLFRGGIP